jgi:hypothetical protein
MRSPRLYEIEQEFDRRKLEDPAGTLRALLGESAGAGRIRPGMKVAITAGSRGVDNLPLLTTTLIEEVRSRGGEPFIVPAMGSHAGATAEGQSEMLRGLGITEESMGAPIVSSMEAVEVGRTPGGAPVYCDKNAFHSDMIVVINRVKVHTAIKGPNESGIVKMIAVGLGKQKGAESMHDHGLAETVPDAARVLLDKAPIGFGVALVENGLDRTAKIAVVEPDNFIVEEQELLKEAKALLPRIPFDSLDVLIVEEMGKNISGTGMDSNIIGLNRRELPGRWTPDVDRLVVLDLTEESHGNACGIGMADITTRRLVDKIDFDAVYANVLTSGFLRGGFIPVTLHCDREAITAALRPFGVDAVRMARIKDTLHLQSMAVSEALLSEVEAMDRVRVVRELPPLTYSAEGNLLPWRTDH